MNRPLAHIAVLVVACVVVFWNALGNGFHLDDAYRVVNNPGVEQFWPPWRHFLDPGTSSALPRIVQYRPLLPLSLSVDYALSGHDLVAYHVGNLLWQILASVAVYGVVRELFLHWSNSPLPAYGALLVAGMFAVHPVSGVPVNYICARDLLMTVTFMMAALLVYLRMRRLGATTGRWLLSLALLLLALLSKKNAVAFPALILLFELLPAGQSVDDGRVWKRVLPFAAVVFGLLAFIRFGLGFSDLGNVMDGSSERYFEAQLQHHVFHYLANFAWPFWIRQLPEDPVMVWKQVVGAAVLLGSWVLAWRWRRRRPLLAFGILGYQALLALTSSFIPMHSEIVAYRPYPASVFLFLLVGVAGLGAGRLGAIGLAVLVAYFAVASVLINPLWKDGQTLFRHTIALGGNRFAYTSLCDNLPDGPEKERLYQEVLAKHPQFVEAHLGLGMTQVAMGKRKEGLDRIQFIVGLTPQNAQVRYTAAQSLMMAGNQAEAARQAAKASELAPDNPVYRAMATHFALEAGENQRALELIQPLLQTRPDFQMTRYYAAMALQRLNRHGEALPLFHQFIRSDPSRTTALYSLGLSYIGLSNWAEAVQVLEACLQRHPEMIDAHNQLAECYRRLGKLAEANRHRLLYTEKQKAARK